MGSSSQQADRWAPSPPTTNIGGSSLHASKAYGQRGRNGQPVGGSMSDGGAPGMGVSRLPGSPAMMEANLQGLRDYRIVVWSKHGVMARSEISVTKAADRIEYAETAALYEYMDLVNGGQGEGLTTEELREVVRAFDVPTSLV